MPNAKTGSNSSEEQTHALSQVQPGTVSSVETTSFPLSMLLLLSLVIRAKVPGNGVGAPVVVVRPEPASHDPPVVVCVVLSRSAGKKRRGMTDTSGMGSSDHVGGAGHGRRRRGRLGVGQSGRQSDEDRVIAVPAPLLLRFLDDALTAGALRDAKDDEEAGGCVSIGLPSLGIQFKALFADSLRRSLGLSEDQQGISFIPVYIPVVSSCVLSNSYLPEMDSRMDLYSPGLYQV
jgi:hypothetical protein